MFEHPKTIEEQLKRPARKQVGEEVLHDLGALKGQIDGATSYNIWYNRWTGFRVGVGEKAPYKLNPRKDIGWTKGEKDPGTYFCMFFARGGCPYGKECRFKHRIPCLEDKEEMPVDIFGRERHGEFKGDLGGVGAFSRENKTLYVGRIAPYDDMEGVIREAFSPFGEIVKINILHGKCVAFVQYSRRIYAEFAKEAMSNQSLERSEILNVRWATEDPNEGVKEEVRQRAEEDVYNALKEHLPEEFTNPILNYNEEQGEEEENKKDHQGLIENQTNQQEIETQNKSSLIRSDVLQSLSQISQQMKYTKAYTRTSSIANNQEENQSKKSKADTTNISLLGNQYDSDSESE
ncbi:hypothetical protein K502DRAFT_311879 [Neoconidiobolus thromboides FSU 785]|nr:hypothetical protein K502DRAFT_311879 [Neoconidiobolus thromboides FSU 785]